MKLFGSLYELVQAFFRHQSSDPTAPTGNDATIYAKSGKMYRRNASNVDEVTTNAETQTLTNKTLTTPVISTISNTGTLTLPTSTDTLVGRATTDTLTNKTLTTPIISSISNTGTITLPTSTDTLVGRDTTDTLTNKTLTSPAINTPNLDGGTASATSRIVVSKETATNLTALTRKQAAIYYDTTNNVLKYDDGSALNTIGTASTATASTPGLVTSFSPIVQSTVKATSAAYTILDNDGYDTINVTTGATQKQIDLPTAADNTGRIITITKVDSDVGAVTVAGDGGTETIDGQTTFTMWKQYSSVTVKCNGTTWFIVASNLNMGFRVSANGAQSPGTGATQLTTLDVGGSSDFDTAGGWSTSTDEYTVRAEYAGMWFISAQVGYNNVTDTNQARVYIYVNGSAVAFHQVSNPTTADLHVSVSTTLRLAAGDTVRIYGSSSGSYAIRNDRTETFLSGFRIGN